MAASELLDGDLKALEAAALVSSGRLLQLGAREGVRELVGLAINALYLLGAVQPPLLPEAIGVDAG